MRASRAPLIVLTGGPGCGKTFATKAIVQLWQSQQKDIRLAAPTGQSPITTVTSEYVMQPDPDSAWMLQRPKHTLSATHKG